MHHRHVPPATGPGRLSVHVRTLSLFFLLLLLPFGLYSQVKILFNATKAESAGNADWVIDADLHNIGYTNGPPVVGQGSESNPQQIPTPAQSGVVAGTAETHWNGGISAWGIDLVKKGYIVETLPYNGAITYGNTTNSQDLSNYKVFIDCEPNIVYTAAEKTAIMQFVQNGGGLFMVSDHTNSDRNNDGWDSPEIWNDLMSNNGIASNPFGITFDLATFSQTTTNIPSLPNDPILHGIMGNVTSAMWSAGTSMTLNPVANSSVLGIIYKSGVAIGNSNVMFAYATFGSGKVAAIGDSSPCDDGTGDPGDQLYNGWTLDAGGNHERLIMNATIWLAESGLVTPGGATVTTAAATSVTTTSAVSGGTVTSEGGSAVTARGICWSTTANPVVAGSHTTDGSGTGAFVSSISDLTPGTAYHVRAYATNSAGTYYGDDIQFTTICGNYTLPFSQSFATTNLPLCWTQVDHQGNGQLWAFGVISGVTPLPVLSGNYAFLNSDGFGSGNSQNADLVSPALDLSGFTSVNLAFSHYFKSYTGSSATVSYSINNGLSWTTISTITVTSTSNPAAFSMAVNATAGQPQVMFKWNYTGTWGYFWAIDDIQVTGTPCVPVPAAISITPSANPVCPGNNITLTATVSNGGTTPVYQWRVNSNNAGTNSPVFTYGPAADDTVSCVLTSNATCITNNPAVSNEVVLTFYALNPTITGPASACNNNTPVTYVSEPGMTGYAWSVSAGGLILSGNGTDSVSVGWNTPGTQEIGVTYGNSAGCTAANPAVLNVTVNAFPDPVFLTNETIPSGSQVCHTAQNITTGGAAPGFLLEAGGSAELIASGFVRFLPGTTVQEAGLLHAYITGECIPCIAPLAPAGSQTSSSTASSCSAVSGDLTRTAIRVFPNPTNGILTIEFNSRAGNEQHRVELYNAKGELSASEWVSGERIHLFSLLARPAGVYFFRVVTDTQVETLKIIRL